MIVHLLHLHLPYQLCSLQVIATTRSTVKGVREDSATLVVDGVTLGVIRSVMRRKGIPIHVLHQGVRVGVVVVAIAIVGMGGVEVKVEGDRGSVSISLTTEIAATDKRVSGNTRKVIVRGTGLMPQ